MILNEIKLQSDLGRNHVHRVSHQSFIDNIYLLHPKFKSFKHLLWLHSSVYIGNGPTVIKHFSYSASTQHNILIKCGIHLRFSIVQPFVCKTGTRLCQLSIRSTVVIKYKTLKFLNRILIKFCKLIHSNIVQTLVCKASVRSVVVSYIIQAH